MPVSPTGPAPAIPAAAGSAPQRLGPSGASAAVGAPGALARGQATAEYALVLLGVAAIALLLAAWAARSGKIGQLFDAVIDELIGKVG